MTTVQESPNGQRVFPPPSLIRDLEEEDHTNNSNNTSPEPLPERCQFTFSDGRQCRLQRSDIQPSLCRFHAEREEQLFGDPAPAGNVVGAALDLPELHSACRDLTTLAGVNRALGQVFRLLAQRRISRQEAATFGYLAQLLLQTVSATRSSRESPAANVYLQDELRGVSKDHQELSRVNKVDAPSDPHSDSSGLRPLDAGPVAVPPAPRADSSREAIDGRTLSTPEPATAVDSSSQPEIPAAACELTPIPRTPSPASAQEPFAAPNPAAHNPHRMSTYENTEFKAVPNEHLHNDRRGVPSKSPFRDETN